MNKEIEIRLSLQRALIGNVSQHLRMVCCDWKEKEWIKLRFYLDIEPNEEEKELVSCILTDLETDLEFPKFYEEIIFSDLPFEKLEKLKLIVYWRNELPVF
ncbi:MAG TPA: hypothetical protein DDY04_07395 [Bacteroidales bacterium]|nr:hypothetical protein [Bacteroidales bacterium]